MIKLLKFLFMLQRRINTLCHVNVIWRQLIHLLQVYRLIQTLVQIEKVCNVCIVPFLERSNKLIYCKFRPNNIKGKLFITLNFIVQIWQVAEISNYLTFTFYDKEVIYKGWLFIYFIYVFFSLNHFWNGQVFDQRTGAPFGYQGTYYPDLGKTLLINPPSANGNQYPILFRHWPQKNYQRFAVKRPRRQDLENRWNVWPRNFRTCTKIQRNWWWQFHSH